MTQTKYIYLQNAELITARKLSKYAVFSGPYFPVFGLNMEIYARCAHLSAKLRIPDQLSLESKIWKQKTKKQKHH